MIGKLLIRALYSLVNTTPVKVKRDESAKQFDLISVKKMGDVGYDLPCTEEMIINPGERRTISTGIHLQIPEHLWATIEGRSSASRWPITDIPRYEQLQLDIHNVGDNQANEPKLHVVTGIIDTGYRGELKAVVINLGRIPVKVEPGDRYAQVIFHLRCVPPVLEVEELDPSERGSTGFGSSGR